METNHIKNVDVIVKCNYFLDEETRRLSNMEDGYRPLSEVNTSKVWNLIMSLPEFQLFCKESFNNVSHIVASSGQTVESIQANIVYNKELSKMNVRFVFNTIEKGVEKSGYFILDFKSIKLIEEERNKISCIKTIIENEWMLVAEETEHRHVKIVLLYFLTIIILLVAPFPFLLSGEIIIGVCIYFVCVFLWALRSRLMSLSRKKIVEKFLPKEREFKINMSELQIKYI